MKRILVTGANGFVGDPICKQLATTQKVRCVYRSIDRQQREHRLNTESYIVGEIGPNTKWAGALDGIEAVVHLAAKVHAMQPSSPETQEEYRRVNVQGTDVLARAAARAGVKRFIYLSSIKVNGEATSRDIGFVETDSPNPQGLYGKSKWCAEQALATVSGETGMEVVILRPPLIYGAGVKANFLSLLRAVDAGWPLPFGRIDNRRSFLYVENLADAVTKCLHHSDAAGRTFLVADAAISIGDLVSKLSLGLGGRARLLPVPTVTLRRIGALVGKSSTVDRLTSSLVINDAEIRRVLGWRPPVAIDDGLKATCNWYKSVGRSAGSIRS